MALTESSCQNCQKCFEDLKKRWHKCIIFEGDYLLYLLMNKFFEKNKVIFLFEQILYGQL